MAGKTIRGWKSSPSKCLKFVTARDDMGGAYGSSRAKSAVLVRT
jgi:hypothetical protein